MWPSQEETKVPQRRRAGQTSSALPRILPPSPASAYQTGMYRTQFLLGHPIACHGCDISGLAWTETNDFYLRDAESRDYLAKSSAAMVTRHNALGSKKANAREIFFTMLRKLELTSTYCKERVDAPKPSHKTSICCLLRWPPDAPCPCSLFSFSPI